MTAVQPEWVLLFAARALSSASTLWKVALKVSGTGTSGCRSSSLRRYCEQQQQVGDHGRARVCEKPNFSSEECKEITRTS